MGEQHIPLVKKENLKQRPAWRAIDGWEEPTHEVTLSWRNNQGEDQFRADVIPRNGAHPGVGVTVSLEELQEMSSEHHVYPFVAPKAGHLATAKALGIPIPAEAEG